MSVYIQYDSNKSSTILSLISFYNIPHLQWSKKHLTPQPKISSISHHTAHPWPALGVTAPPRNRAEDRDCRQQSNPAESVIVAGGLGENVCLNAT